MKKIYINPGHSNTDPGAVSYETERRLNVAVSNYMNEYLLNNYVCETRVNPGTMDRLSVVCTDANNWDADLFVSIHFNAGGGDGFECYVYNKNRFNLGEIFAKYVKEVGQNLRYPDNAGEPFGVKVRLGLYVLKNTSMPAVLCEGAFVDNLKDIQGWNDNIELKKLGIAYAKAAAEFLNLEKKVAQKPKEIYPIEPKEIYPLEQFIRDVQGACGAKVNGIADPETLSKTVTVSFMKNRRHPVVKYIQKRLYYLGYTELGTNFEAPTGMTFRQVTFKFQRDNGCYPDGEFKAQGKAWKKLLGME